MEKKYKFTGDTMNYVGRTLHRIQAVQCFGDVKAGDLGGWIESERNLLHYDLCWVGDDAMVYGDACVFVNAQVYEDACVMGRAVVCGDARVYGHADIRGSAVVTDEARIYDYALVTGLSVVKDKACVHGASRILDYATIFGDANIYNCTSISGMAKIFVDCTNTDDHICIGPIGSRMAYATFVLSNGGIYVATGCFKGTVEEFKEAVMTKHAGTRYETAYLDAIEFAKRRLGGN